jgi:hypothetical protein
VIFFTVLSDFVFIVVCSVTFLYLRSSPFFIQLQINTHSLVCLTPEPDGVIKTVARKTIRHYRQLYVDHPDPIAFMPVAVDTSGSIYDDFLRLLFLHAHREASGLANDIPEESGHFRFLRAACLANIKGSVGLILTKVSVMSISIPLDLSSRPCQTLYTSTVFHSL